MVVTLTNKFHKTCARVQVADRAYHIMSKNQYMRAYKKLCGVEGCTCNLYDRYAEEGNRVVPLIHQLDVGTPFVTAVIYTKP